MEGPAPVKPADGEPGAPAAGSLLRSAGLISALTFLSRLLGLVREQVFAALVGAGHAGIQADAFQVAFRIPNLLRDLFAEGALSAAFVPTYARTLREGGRQAAFDLASRLLNVLAVVMGVLVLLGLLAAEPIVRALADGARLVITGRAADPSLFVAPLAYSLGWRLDAWPALARGTLAGHLLECGGQVTGGYFADPGRKDVAGLERLGFPIAEVADEGPIVVTKVSGSGGAVTAATCKEQLLYEIHDPAA